MKNLYNILNEGILDVDELSKQLDDQVQFGGLKSIFNTISIFIDDARREDNRWYPASPTGAGKSISYAPSAAAVQKLFMQVRSFIESAKNMEITQEQAEIIAKNQKDFVVGQVFDFGKRLKLDVAIPQGSKSVIYSIESLDQFSEDVFEIAILPIDPRNRRGDTFYYDLLKNISSASKNNFVIPYNKETKKEFKKILYNFDGFVRG